MDITSIGTPTKQYNEFPAVTPEKTNFEGPPGSAPPAPIRISRTPTQEIEASDEGSGIVPWEASTSDKEEEAALAAYMMYSPRNAPIEFPELQLEAWTYVGQRPNPINISKARKILAAGYATIPCEVPGAGVHGHAWIIETKAEWLERDGTATVVTVPTMPMKNGDYSLMATIKYNDEMSMFKLYNHLMQEGKRKLIEWFGKSMFDDLHRNGILPNTITASEMLKHLEKTYSQSYDRRQYLEQVEKDLNSTYDPKKPVETYFMKLQEARTNARLLGQPYTDEIVMNKALKQFEKQYGKDAYKAEKKWNTKLAEDNWDDEEKKAKIWATFKEYWKTEIHQWETVSKTSCQANQAMIDHVDSLSRKMNAMEINMNALSIENQSYRDENSALIASQVDVRHGYQAEQTRRSGSSSDDISTITDYMNQKFEALNSQLLEMKNQVARNESQLLESARQRDPASYKHMNEGKGRKFNKYCWHCGVNCTHWTRKCYQLSDDKKKQYRDADFDNTMNGSTKFMERRGKYQRDFGFDSL